MRLTNEQWENLEAVIDEWLFAFESGSVNRNKMEDFSLSLLREFLPPLTIGHVDNGNAIANLHEALGIVAWVEEFAIGMRDANDRQREANEILGELRVHND